MGSRGLGVFLVSPPNRVPLPPHKTTTSVVAGFSSKANEKSPKQRKENLYVPGKMSYFTLMTMLRQALYYPAPSRSGAKRITEWKNVGH